eukprot:743493-Pelagomonas_calceolata.AAC.4
MVTTWFDGHRNVVAVICHHFVVAVTPHRMVGGLVVTAWSELSRHGRVCIWGSCKWQAHTYFC